jgi:predicted nucleic acid-binding protein
MALLVDSDILIEVSRARDFRVLTKWRELMESDTSVLYSPVTAAELWAGAKPNEFDAIRRLFDSLTCVPIEREIGAQAGHFLRQFGKSHSLEVADALIAASAAITGALLWTRNRKHFPMKELSFFL